MIALRIIRNLGLVAYHTTVCTYYKVRLASLR